jgi:hypothetical protein
MHLGQYSFTIASAIKIMGKDDNIEDADIRYGKSKKWRNKKSMELRGKNS